MQLRDSYDAIYERAGEFVAQGEWEQAVEEYQRIFNRLNKLSPESRAKHAHLDELFTRTVLGLNMILTHVGAHDQAIEMIDQVLDSMPEDRTSWQRERARHHVMKDDVEEGLVQLQALAEEQPDDPFTELSLGEAYMRKKSYDEAVEHYNRAIELAETDEDVKTIGYRNLFDVYLVTGELQKATEVWEAAVALDEAADRAVSQLYDAYLAAEDVERVEALAARDRNPLRRGFYAGKAHDLAGDTVAAEERWRKVARREIDAETEGVEYWMEAALRVGQAQRVIDSVSPIFAGGQANLLSAILFGSAWALKGETEHADSFFSMMRESPVGNAGGQLPSEGWELLDSLVAEESVKSVLRHHFEGGEESGEEVESEVGGETGEEPLSADDSPESPGREPVEEGTENTE
jgi:tetratricopeptide (TPR) repeat protein